MPKGTFTSAEKNVLPGQKPIKNRLKQLFLANASGDLKIKQIFANHSDTPRPLKKCKAQKNKLNVMWRSNNKTWVKLDPIFASQYYFVISTYGSAGYF